MQEYLPYVLVGLGCAVVSAVITSTQWKKRIAIMNRFKGDEEKIPKGLLHTYLDKSSNDERIITILITTIGVFACIMAYKGWNASEETDRQKTKVEERYAQAMETIADKFVTKIKDGEARTLDLYLLLEKLERVKSTTNVPVQKGN